MSTFFDLSPEEVSAWRNGPVTKLFAEWIDAEAKKAQRAEHHLLAIDSIGKARVACGYTDALHRVYSGMEVPEFLPDLIAEEFVDSATRPSRRGKK